ncbi:DUF397 domain-containing protein [Actinoplanes sp. TFC3]|uniref:DUF397 domain-containing protein n=1 Tax=Actinoplanes sp. TFC3 TaxID=1710355 RepID=UPI003518327D
MWHRSSRCANGTCVEVARTGDEYLIRDGKNPAGTPLRLPAPAWNAFVAAVKAGEFG